MIGDTSNDIAQIRFGVEVVQLCRGDQRVDCDTRFPAIVRAEAQEVFPSPRTFECTRLKIKARVLCNTKPSAWVSRLLAPSSSPGSVQCPGLFSERLGPTVSSTMSSRQADRVECEACEAHIAIVAIKIASPKSARNCY
jgi:hypothetical protein